MLPSKALAGQISAPNTELFSIRLGIDKATSMNIQYIIFIIDSLVSANKIVDLSVHSEQAYLLTIYFVLRLFFSYSLNHKIKS